MTDRPTTPAQVPGIYRSRVGDCVVTSVHDGINNRQLDANFVRNAAIADVEAAVKAAFLPWPVLPITFTALHIATGTRSILIDTGTAGLMSPTAGFLGANLAAAGIDAASIDTVVISHFHADHINGLKTADNRLAFPNAEIAVPEVEWAFWMSDANMAGVSEHARHAFQNVRRVFGDIPGERIRTFAWESEAAPGLTALAAPGHTPGHTAFALASGSDSLLVWSDITNHPVLSVRHPDWSPVFDMDMERTIATRRAFLDRAATDRLRVAGFHFPFPGIGHIARTAEAYDFVPAQWSPMV